MDFSPSTASVDQDRLIIVIVAKNGFGKTSLALKIKEKLPHLNFEVIDNYGTEGVVLPSYLTGKNPRKLPLHFIVTSEYSYRALSLLEPEFLILGHDTYWDYLLRIRKMYNIHEFLNENDFAALVNDIDSGLSFQPSFRFITIDFRKSAVGECTTEDLADLMSLNVQSSTGELDLSLHAVPKRKKNKDGNKMYYVREVTQKKNVLSAIKKGMLGSGTESMASVDDLLGGGSSASLARSSSQMVNGLRRATREPSSATISESESAVSVLDD